MVLTSFNKELYEKDLREDTFKRIIEKFSLQVVDAEKYMEEYWK